MTTALPLTDDELTVLLEALREYEMRLPASHVARNTIVQALIFRFSAALLTA